MDGSMIYEVPQEEKYSVQLWMQSGRHSVEGPRIGDLGQEGGKQRDRDRK